MKKYRCIGGRIWGVLQYAKLINSAKVVLQIQYLPNFNPSPPSFNKTQGY